MCHTILPSCVSSSIVSPLCTVAGYVEEAGVDDDLFERPRHPYTRRLLEAVPRLDRALPLRTTGTAPMVVPSGIVGGCPFAPRCDFRVDRCREEMPGIESGGGRSVRCFRWADLTPPQDSSEDRAYRKRMADVPSNAVPLLEVVALDAGYVHSGLALRRDQRQRVEALRRVSFEVKSGVCLAIIGESGSGKTTLARCLAGLHSPSSGQMIFAGTPLRRRAGDRSRDVRREIQIVFPDPESSLNPSMDSSVM